MTSTEWKNFYGGKKTATGSNVEAAEFRRLPFYCCSLSFQPCIHPYASLEGHVFDLENILPFIRIFVYPLALTIELMFGPIRIIKLLSKKVGGLFNRKILETEN